MNTKIIPYTFLGIKDKNEQEKLINIFSKLIEKGNFVLGNDLNEFEKNFSKFCKTKYSIGVNSGTDALFLILKALGIKKGDEVITVSNSFIATVGAIEAVEAKPVFVDVNYNDMLINTSLIEEKITSKTKAIIPVHLTGLMCDMENILKIADKNNLYVIEDTCQSIDAEYENKKAGSIGDASAFSLIPLKNLGGIGDGGAITTNNLELNEKIKSYRNHGLKDRDHADFFGYNSRLDNINAAILDYKLKSIEKITNEKRKLASIYNSHLSSLKKEGKIDYYMDDKKRKNVFHLFVIKIKERDKLQKYLKENNIETKIHYPIPIHKQKAFTNKYGETSLPVTEKLSKEMLSLPIWIGMENWMVEKICVKIKEFFK